MSASASQTRRRRVEVQHEAGEINTLLQQPNGEKVVIQRRDASQMSTPTQQPRRKKSIAQLHETGEMSTPVRQKNRRKLAVQREAEENSEVGINMLCTTCKHIFASAKDRAQTFSWYYDILGLIDSAAKGCHFCVQVLRTINLADIESLKRELAKLNVEKSKSVEKCLKAETRYYEHMGVTFMLRRRDAGQRNCLASLSLYFPQDISK